MESLRWILLGGGALFVLIIYLLGRSRKQRSHSMVDDLEEDLPEFSAGSLDHVDEGVGRVRVISRGDDDAEHSDYDDVYDENGDIKGVNPDAIAEDDETGATAADVGGAKGRQSAANMSDIIVVYILPKPNEKLIGGQINSAAQAMGFSFGDMNIYHFKAHDRNVFSLANMLEPGSFDPDTIHDLKTSGLTIFMQLHEENPMDDLTEMLQRSYQMAGLLGARLCNSKRQPLTEQDAENYREKVRRFIESKNFELSMET